MSYAINLMTAALLLSTLRLVAAKSGQNPCHPRKYKRQAGVDVTCTSVRIPPDLCTRCNLKPFRINGEFEDCASIYDLDDTRCQNQLKMYARENRECDPRRFEQVSDMSLESNRQQLDYFLYSVCEQCCDCVPLGSKKTEYAERLETGTLRNVYRGNCPAHARFDICKVLPSIKYTMKIGVNDRSYENWPKICGLVREWGRTEDGMNWKGKSRVNMDERIARFLRNFWNDVGCKRQKIWKSCTGLEGAQDRL